MILAITIAIPRDETRPRRRYARGEASRRLVLCTRLIARRRAQLLWLADAATGAEARAIGDAIAALGRLHRTFRRLLALVETGP